MPPLKELSHAFKEGGARRAIARAGRRRTGDGKGCTVFDPDDRYTLAGRPKDLPGPPVPDGHHINFLTGRDGGLYWMHVEDSCIYQRDGYRNPRVPPAERVIRYRCVTHKLCNVALPKGVKLCNGNTDGSRLHVGPHPTPLDVVTLLQDWIFSFLLRNVFALYGANMGVHRLRILIRLYTAIVYGPDARPHITVKKVEQVYLRCARKSTPYVMEHGPITLLQIRDLERLHECNMAHLFVRHGPGIEALPDNERYGYLGSRDLRRSPNPCVKYVLEHPIPG